MKKNKGFTVLELLIVITIIAVLTSIVLASIFVARNKGKNSAHMQNLIQIRTALELYAADHNGHYPDTHLGNFGHWLTPDTRYPVLQKIGSATEWIPGLVSGGYIAHLPGYTPDGKNRSSSLDDPTFLDCSTQSTSYFYAGSDTHYIVLVTCPEGGENASTAFFNDPSVKRQESLRICLDNPNWEYDHLITGEGRPCTDPW